MYFLGKILGAVLTPLRTLFYWCSRAIPGLKRMGNITFPMRMAIMMFVFLLILTIAGFIGYIRQQDTADAWFWLRNLWIIIILNIAIPVCLYYAIKMLLEKEVSRFPDIDQAWKLGQAALQQQGIRMDETPIFLVLGSSDDSQASSLLQASQLRLNVPGVPEGPAALHWYANQDAIFLFCSAASCLSKLVDISKNASPGDPDMGGPSPAAPQPAIQGTVVASEGQNLVDAVREEEAGPAPASSGAGAIFQTMEIGQTAAYSDTGSAPAPPFRILLSTNETNNQVARLQYVCQLLFKARQPVCPVNGVLTLMPFNLINNAASQVQMASMRDMSTLRDTLKLRCPVTAVVTEMQTEGGFQELVRRVGMKRAAEQRFGKGCNLWSPATDERLEAVARHACGAFEDWTYLLYREQDGLKKPGNSKLFSLLCTIRGDFTAYLRDILSKAYGYDPKTDHDGEKQHLLFSGCYFAATGDTEDRQAFAKSVIHKVLDQESELEWTEKAFTEDDRYQALSNIAVFFAGAALVALVAMIVYKIWWSG